MKSCSKCGISKPTSEFSKNSSSKDGLQTLCKSCAKEHHVNWRNINQEKLKEKNANWRKNNQEKIKEKNANWYKNNPEKHKEICANYYKNNTEKRKEHNANYYKNNTEKAKETTANYQKTRKKTDPLFKLSSNIRSMICNSLKNGGYKKTTKTAKILGCTFEEFQTHIEAMFAEGMSWNNQGEWHLDHFFPVSLATTEEEILRLNHYKNLRPLWEKDNLKKSGNYPFEIVQESSTKYFIKTTLPNDIHWIKQHRFNYLRENII